MPHRRLAAAPAAVAAVLAVAACGGHSGPIASAQTGSQPGPGTVTLAKCMRAHDEAFAMRLTTPPVGPYQTSWPGLWNVGDWKAATFPRTVTITGRERAATRGLGCAARSRYVTATVSPCSTAAVPVAASDRV